MDTEHKESPPLEMRVLHIDSQDLEELMDMEYLNMEILPDVSNIFDTEIFLNTVGLSNKFETEILPDLSNTFDSEVLPDVSNTFDYDPNLKLPEPLLQEDQSSAENKSQDMTYNSECGWRSTAEFFNIYKKKIRTEKNLYNMHVKNQAIDIFFSVKENGNLSTEETLLAIELFNRLIIQDFITKFKDCCEMRTDVHLNDEKWTLNLQKLDKENLKSFVTCLVLAKKYYDRRFTICSPIIYEILIKSGKEVTGQDIVQHELKVLEELEYNVNVPILSTYCNLLFEMVHGESFGVTRQVFYKVSAEYYKIYFLNHDKIIDHQEEAEYSNIELVGAGILFAIVYQCANDEEMYLPSILLDDLEILTDINRDIILRVFAKFIELTLDS